LNPTDVLRRLVRGRGGVGFAVAVAVAFVLALCVGAARPAGSDQVTITMLVGASAQPSFEVLIPNFERVYPNITVNASYAPTTAVLNQLELTELEAGNAPDIVQTGPGCGTPLSVCVLAKAGYLAPLVNKRWTRWSMRSVISLSKYGPGLFAFLTSVGEGGVFTNDDLFRKLGLKVPQTFAQLLGVCQQAKANGTVAFDFGGSDSSGFDWLIMDLALANVYAKDTHWAGERRADAVSFEGSAGWHQTLQQVIDMNAAGCFQSGAVGTTQAGAIAEFAQGQGLMLALTSGQKGLLDADVPQFNYSFHPFPAGSSGGPAPFMAVMGVALGVNAHSSPASEAAAQTFIDFVARPEQDALYAKLKGGLTQYQLLHGQIQPYMASFVPLLTAHAYLVDPVQTWWNPNVGLALQQTEVGLLTGQSTVDGVLTAMDAAWNQGPG
jgi:raffinose/stachyose/melibiose transport system substrate-binding protein